MATGIPAGSARQSNNRSTFALEYDGKVPLIDVINTQPASLNPLITVAGNPRNRLVYGDNLGVLRALLDDEEIAGRVRLIYIDPPYATRSAFESRDQNHAYHDLIWGTEYLEFLRQRLILLHELLAEDGSIYVHLDSNMAFTVKVLMDEVFGERNFRNWITRKKCNPKNYTRNQYGNVTDYILFYSKSDRYVWNPPLEPWDETAALKEYTYTEPDTGRRYKKVPIHAPGVRHGATGKPWRGKLPPPGKHWQYTPDKLEEMDQRGEIYWSSTGNPRRKIYLDDSRGIYVQDLWLDYKDAHNQNIKITGYPTEKNLDMLRRIVSASSNPGDIVLDAFAGSGTTAVASEELGRQWIAIDNSLLAMETMVKRLVNGTSPMGDFVQKRPPEVHQPLLFETGGILQHGLVVYVEESKDLEPISEQQAKRWSQILVPANGQSIRT